MSAPYKVKMTVSNAEGEEMTVFQQNLKTYFELVGYQEAISNAVIDLGKKLLKTMEESAKK